MIAFVCIDIYCGLFKLWWDQNSAYIPGQANTPSKRNIFLKTHPQPVTWVIFNIKTRFENGQVGVFLCKVFLLCYVLCNVAIKYTTWIGKGKKLVCETSMSIWLILGSPSSLVLTVRFLSVDYLFLLQTEVVRDMLQWNHCL